MRPREPASGAGSPVQGGRSFGSCRADDGVALDPDRPRARAWGVRASATARASRPRWPKVRWPERCGRAWRRMNWVGLGTRSRQERCEGSRTREGTRRHQQGTAGDAGTDGGERQVRFLQRARRPRSSSACLRRQGHRCAEAPRSARTAARSTQAQAEEGQAEDAPKRRRAAAADRSEADARCGARPPPLQRPRPSPSPRRHRRRRRAAPAAPHAATAEYAATTPPRLRAPGRLPRTLRRTRAARPRRASGSQARGANEPGPPCRSLQVVRGATPQTIAEKSDRSPADIVKILFMAGEMVTATTSLTDESIEMLATELDMELRDHRHRGRAAGTRTIRGRGSTSPCWSRVRRWSPSWVTSTTARPSCWTRSARPTSSRASSAASPSTSAPTRRTSATATSRSSTPPATRRSPRCARAAHRSPTSPCWWWRPTTASCRRPSRRSTTRRRPGCRSWSRSTRSTRKTPTPTGCARRWSNSGVVPSEWGGTNEFVDVSAREKLNLDTLLETILLVADLEELKGVPSGRARGTVIEAHLDKGRGPVATVLVQRGTLDVGDALVCGTTYAKIRAMQDEYGQTVEHAGPSKPVVILGWEAVPASGDEFREVSDEREARHIASEREARVRAAELVISRPPTLSDLHASGRTRRDPRTQPGGQGRRAGLARRAHRRVPEAAAGRGAREHRAQRRGRHHRERHHAGHGLAAPSSSGSTCVPTSKPSSSPTRKASTSARIA